MKWSQDLVCEPAKKEDWIAKTRREKIAAAQTRWRSVGLRRLGLEEEEEDDDDFRGLTIINVTTTQSAALEKFKVVLQPVLDDDVQFSGRNGVAAGGEIADLRREVDCREMENSRNGEITSVLVVSMVLWSVPSSVFTQLYIRVTLSSNMANLQFSPNSL